MSGSFLSAAPMPAFTGLNRIRVMRLYRRALKLQMSWTPRYDVFRSQAIEIRRRFEENRHISDPRVLQKIIDAAEKELYDNRHPDPYIPPTAPGGSKWERNIPPARLEPPNIRKDYADFQTFAEDQRPLWQIALTLPVTIYKFWKLLLFPSPQPATLGERNKERAMKYREYQAQRNAEVEELLKIIPYLTEAEKPTRRRWEKLIWTAKHEVNEWDWDAEFGHIEDSGDREALYLAIFESWTKEPRLRRERFHREALQRAKRLGSDLPPVEKREFLAKEVAIAAAHGHIGNIHYDEITRGIEGEKMIDRDKLYKALVVNFFIPHLEKFKSVVKKRDDNSLVEQTRYFWQPKDQLIAKVNRLQSLCKLERPYQKSEKAEWIYELYMAPKLYTEMERRPGAAMEYIYWTQGAQCVPPGYESPDEEMWRLEKEILEKAQKEVDEVKESLRKDFGDRATAAVDGRS